MPKAATLAAFIAGGLPAVVLASALVLWNHFSDGPSRPTSELERVTRPTPLARVPDPEPASEPEPAPIAAKPVSVSAPMRAFGEPTSVAATELLDEASVLSTLHDLAAADPPQSLLLAREAVNRFPDSPSAPEFQWNAVKALFNMGRLDEAKDEAQVMLRKYPNSSFTGDVIHHLLNPPPNPPGVP